MILILSKPVDKDTDCVIEWLNFYKVPVLRINDEELMQGDTSFYYDACNVENSYFKTISQKIYLRDIKVVWYRKFGFLTEYERKLDSTRDLMRFLYNEFRALRELILSALQNKKWIFKRDLLKTKLEVLNTARNVGLKIPKTIITTEKKQVANFLEESNSLIITKPLSESAHIKSNKNFFSLSTTVINNVKELNDNFSPSFFQEYIDKEIELRIFYIMGKCYAMAIFSQSNPQTKFDFRAYDWENPNRYIPYKIPADLEIKIDLLMKELKLNTGSLDIIKSAKSGEYYFLEINPSGQFGMTAFPCNYPLHKLVAQNLILLNDEK